MHHFSLNPFQPFSLMIIFLFLSFFFFFAIHWNSIVIAKDLKHGKCPSAGTGRASHAMQDAEAANSMRKIPTHLCRGPGGWAALQIKQGIWKAHRASPLGECHFSCISTCLPTWKLILLVISYMYSLVYWFYSTKYFFVSHNFF